MDRFAIGLSNEENQFLEENVENKSKELFLIESQIEENQNRIRMLEEHRKIIDEELQTIRVTKFSLFSNVFVVKKSFSIRRD